MDKTDTIRVQKFRQLKTEIRGSQDHLIVGIDVSKDNHHAFFGSANGKTLLRKLIVSNDLKGMSKLISRAESIKIQYGFNEVVFGFEPTGTFHKPLAMYLMNNNYPIVMVSGVATKRNRELLNGRWDKNDTKCAANVADLIAQGKFLFYESPISAIVQLRELLSLRERMKKNYHILKMRIRNNLVAKYFPEFDKYFGSNSNESLSIVKWYLDPKKIAEMNFEQFACKVTTRNSGIAQKQRLRKIHNLSTESIGCPITSSARFEARLIVEEVKRTKDLIGLIEKRIAQLAKDFYEYHCLLSIPGFGPYVSAMVLAKIGEPFRFDHRGQVLKLAGFDLSANRSGKTSHKARATISKKGSNALRYALYQAALVASSRNEHFIAYFTDKIRNRAKEHGIRIKIRVKLAAKMLIIAWTLMKNNEKFYPEYLFSKD